MTMDEVLIVSRNDNENELKSMLNKAGYVQISSVKSSNEAKARVREKEYSLVLINTPLNDEFGYDLSLYILEKSTAGVLLLVKSEIYNEATLKTEDKGALVLPKPINMTSLYRFIKFAEASRIRWERVIMENNALRRRLEETKVIERAKALLMVHKSMSEEEAHRYIERKAMDIRDSKKAVAEKIIKFLQEIK